MIDDMITMRCADCAFYDAEAGRCRIAPPQIGGDGRGIWPAVGPEDWCGEFEFEDPAPGPVEFHGR